jgi:hypothetical protein
MIQEAAQESVSRRGLLRIIGAGTALGVVAGGTVLSFMLDDKKQKPLQELPGGIACMTVHDHLIGYVAYKIEDSELRKKITKHLINCDGCRASYQEICCGNVSGCEQRPKKVYVRPCQHNPPAP